MNLLLLLSAMLTALSGAGVDVRAPQVPVAVNSVATVAAEAGTAAIAAACRPLAALPRIDRVVAGSALVRWQLVPAAPLYLSRRRE